MKIFLGCSMILLFASCTTSKFIAKTVQQDVLQDTSLRNAHVGISIYDPATSKYLYSYQAEKYFVPASNTKIVTCYAAMKYLKDSITGLEYAFDNSSLIFRGTGDPTLLHGDYKKHPVYDFLKNQNTKLVLADAMFTANRWGAGWTVNDITASYAPERNELPVYGNVIRIYKRGDSIVSMPALYRSQVLTPAANSWRIDFERPSLNENVFNSITSAQNFTSREIPFVTGKFMSALVLLSDTLKKDIALLNSGSTKPDNWKKIYSQHTDSMLKPLMHRSDNFFAEQTLLLVSNEVLGVMNDAKIIDTLLKTDFKELPQKPRWADGSGLSRYNLFSPNDFISILNKMKNEFGMERIKVIFPTGNEGTLNNFYKKETGKIFAKTGTLSGVVALSGFVYTKQNKLLIFSMLVNNHQSNAAAVRRAIEKLVIAVREKY